MMITIVDYKMRILGSIHNMLKRLVHKSLITCDLEILIKASMLILPSVDTFDVAIENIHDKGLWEVLKS